jgi:hypothetical protein
MNENRSSAIVLMGRMCVLYHIMPEDIFTTKELEDALKRIAEAHE